MAKQKFNLNSLLNQASAKTESKEQGESKQEANGYKIESISVYDLIPSEDNFYSTENIEDLKQSIEINGGVKQNLIVTPSSEPGKYKLISGHRRHKASLELTEEGKSGYETLPCIIERDIDKDKEQLLLIMSNSTTRILTDYEKTKQAETLKEILKKIKQKENIPGRTREIIADILDTSPSQIARMESISKKLTPELKEEFKEQKIGISAAYELSKKPEQEQKEIHEKFKETGKVEVKEMQREEPPKEQTEEPAKTTNYERLKRMTIDEMAEFLYIHLSKKGQSKTLEWLKEESEE